MRKSFLIATLAATATLYIGCFADDSAPGDQAGGSAGRGGAAGSSSGGAGGVGGNTAGASGAGAARDGGGGASDAGGATDAAGAGGAGAGGAGAGGAGAGGAAGTGGTAGMAGSGGTGIPDPCAGKSRALPVTVFSTFTAMRICSGGTCTAPAPPYYFTAIPNPNCDEVIPDGGIVPPFADAGAADGDAGTADVDAADAVTEDVATERSTDGLPMDSAGIEASADISVVTDGGADAETGADAVEAAADAAAPSCYKFLYNPACPTGLCWAGVIFTQSAGGMADPGICIESGATKITFQARASRPEARIKFGAIREGLLQTEFFLNITTEWATYEVTIPAGEPYNSYSSGATGVWNGFSIIVEPQDHPDGTYIFVKDAVWVK